MNSNSDSDMSWRSFAAKAKVSAAPHLSTLKSNIADQAQRVRQGLEREFPAESSAIAGQVKPQGWRDWVGKQIRGQSLPINDAVGESVTLFPGVFGMYRHFDLDLNYTYRMGSPSIP